VVKTYSGILEVDGYGCLKCGDFYLIERLSGDFKQGDPVFIRYFITDKAVTEDEATKALLEKTLGVATIDSLNFELDAYSEWTILEYDEKAVIGGHDLFSELQSAEGKYLLLIVESRR